uniref:Pre-mRNA-splicing ATP-dependent RNA helicase PRP28 (EC) n=1 Tax=Ganoderma boninense TaxID=34458 RepID=A0A5K1JXJ9_9APHY|nr:Pre-mRNA-splicing ATP-dependent RNA helicase PRP28 (EC [Ganoderma boninense]
MTRFRCPSGSLARAKTGSMQNVTAHAKSAAKERGKGKGRAVPRLETIEENEAGGTDTHHTEPAPEPGPSRGAKKPKGKSKARATVKSNTSRREAEIRTQIKKSMVQVHSNRGQWSFVFVGNLSSATENKDLRRHFASCGQISDIQIRASGGVCVPTAKLPTPYWGMGTPYESVHYATIRFKTPEGARNAMGMSGTVVMGKRIIVTVNAIELPETVNIVGEHLRKKTAPPDDTKRSFWQGKYGQLKRLTIEKTEPCISEGPATGPGAALLVAGLGKRVGASTAGGSTAAGDQNRHAPRWPLLLGSFPKTLA